MALIQLRHSAPIAVEAGSRPGETTFVIGFDGFIMEPHQVKKVSARLSSFRRVLGRDSFPVPYFLEGIKGVTLSQFHQERSSRRQAKTGRNYNYVRCGGEKQ